MFILNQKLGSISKRETSDVEFPKGRLLIGNAHLVNLTTEFRTSAHVPEGWNDVEDEC